MSTDSAHFTNPHTIIGLIVVTLGTLQPLNAFLRPHNPPMGEQKAMKRKLWEYLHKGSGYTAVILGMLNVFFGALLTMTLGFDATPMVIGLLFGGAGALSVIVYVIVSWMNPDNMCSRSCVGMGPPNEM